MVWARNLSAKTDIQAVLRVIGWRNTQQRSMERLEKRYGELGYVLDLRKASLQGVDLSRLNIVDALLSESYLDGANLSWTEMENSDLRWSQLNGTILRDTGLSGMGLSEARLEGADMLRSSLVGAKLRVTHLKDCDLSFANAKGADFSQATLQAVSLNNVTFDDTTNWNVASSKGSSLQENDFSKRSDILPSFFEHAFGDGSVRLPSGFKAGEDGLRHWEPAVLETREFYRRWRLWLQDVDYGSD